MTRIKILQRVSAASVAALFLTLLIGGNAAAQTASTSLSAQAALVTEMDVNGLKVIVKRRPASSTVAGGLFFRGGTRNATAENAGLENLTLSAMTEGSAKFPRAMLRREIAGTGTQLGSSSGYDFGVLSFGSTKEFFDRGWAMFTDIALHPAFDPADFALVRQRLVTSVTDDQDDPDSYLQLLVNQTVNAKTTYANDPRGTVGNLGKFSVDDLRKYHKDLMQTSRMLLVIVGDVDPEAIRKGVMASFGTLPRGNYKDPGAPTFDFSKGTLDVTQRTLPTNYVEGVFSAPAPADPDYYAMRVATTILRDRVFEEVRVKRNLSYAPNADMGTGAGTTANIYVTAVDANQAVRLMLDEMNKLRTEPVSDRDIAGIAGQSLTTYFLANETNAAQAGELARYELIGGGWRNSFRYLDKVKAVTPADIQRVAQKYMKNVRFVVLGDPSAINRSVFLPAS